MIFGHQLRPETRKFCWRIFLSKNAPQLMGFNPYFHILVGVFDAHPMVQNGYACETDKVLIDWSIMLPISRLVSRFAYFLERQ